VAGIGGVMADFSDYEVSVDNYFKMGSMDLTVSDGSGFEYNGANVPALIIVANGWPDCSKDRSFDIHNAGENEQVPPWVYIHFKNLDCNWVETKHTDTTPYAWLTIEDDEVVRWTSAAGGRIGINEPQDVAIFGGVAGENVDGAPVVVPGIGDAAICLLTRILQVDSLGYSDEYDSAAPLRASWAAVPVGERHYVDLMPYDVAGNNDGIVTLDELECEQVLMFTLTGCKMRWMNISLRAVDIGESEFTDPQTLEPMDFFSAGEWKFENWPTNATMNQKVEWDIAFEMIGQATQPQPPA
jgi:hypothetical protein